MKTTLTLNNGTFYFMSDINLVKGIPAEVDLTTLTEKEVRNVKSYVASGYITSSEDLSSYSANPVVQELEQQIIELQTKPESADQEDKVKAETKADAEEEVKEAAETDYSKMVKKELFAELKKRKIETDLTRNEDLIELLKEDDNKNK